MNKHTKIGREDLQIAREAAAIQAAESGYPQLARPYREGEWDNDNEVQSALIALRLARQSDCIEISTQTKGRGGQPNKRTASI
jgi:hypothetical protein